MMTIIRTFLLTAILLITSICSFADTTTSQTVLTSFEFDIVGIGLKASPEYQAVPKGIASKVNASFEAAGFNLADLVAQLPNNYTVRAELSGPAFQTPISLITKPGTAFDLPTLAVTGRYTLANIRLVDGSGTTLFGAIPQVVAIESIPDPLITSVTTRQLTVQELQDRGVTFDKSNFIAYEFTAGIATSSGQVPLTLPVIIPGGSVLQTTPIIDAPSTISLPQPSTVIIPPDVPQNALPQNLVVEPFMLSVPYQEGGAGVAKLPPIPGIVVIPGNIGFLHQYFSALVLISNGAPLQSGLSIRDVKADISFSSGEDMSPGTDAIPGDDPLRMAKGATGYFPRSMSVMSAGPDGKIGTPDDVGVMKPGESGQADFTIEGLKEGTHKVDFDITAILDGLPIGPVTIKGKASGAVLVRNPNFTITLGHPATIRAGENYDLFITVTNTGKNIANMVTVNLDPRALSGSAFVDGESNSKSLDTILPGSAGTIKFRLKSQRTGKVTATAFESPDVQGRFILRAGVGENNIPLSPDSLILPYTGSVPSDLVVAAVGLLGQAWSVATAPTGALPASVLPISKQTVTSRAYDLSEAGLRILIGDDQIKAVSDLVFDYFGSDVYNKGFDSLRRTSTMGQEVNNAVGAILKTGIDQTGIIQFQASLADKVSYRPAHLSVVTSNAPVRLRLTDASGNHCGGLTAGEVNRSIPYGDSIAIGGNDGWRSNLILATRLESASYTLELTAEGTSSFNLGVVLPDSVGVLTQYVFSGIRLDQGARGNLILVPGSGNLQLAIDDNGDGVVDRVLAPSSIVVVPDHAPHIVAATQLTPDFGPGGDKHGRNVAVLFSGRVSKETAQNAANYGVDGNLVKQVVLQPGNRMAFMLLREGIGPFYNHSLTVQGVSDTSANVMTQPETLPIRITAKGPAAVVTGTVRTARGEPVPNATVRLYQLIWYPEPLTGIPEPRYALFTQKLGNSDGSYSFEYVLQNDDPGGPFQIEVVNPVTNEAGGLITGVMYHGQRLQLDIFMKAKGRLSGVVRNVAGNPVAGASVAVNTLADNRGQIGTTDASGAFSFNDLMVGAYSLAAVSQATQSEGRTMGTLPEDGSVVTQDITIQRVADIARGKVVGKVLGTDGSTPRAGVIVIVNGPSYQNWQRTAQDGSFSFDGVFAGTITVTARDDSTGEQSESSGTLSIAGQTVMLNVIMRGTGSVRGLVKRDDGKSAEGLYVIAGFAMSANGGQQMNRLVQTDAGGVFRFDTLPIGNVSVQVLDPRDFNRTVASGTVSILSAGDTANIDLFVPLKALATGTIQGTVHHRDGSVWANASIKLPVGDFNYYLYQADSSGKFIIPNLSLGGYTLTVVAGNEVINASTDLWYDTQVRTLELRPVAVGTVTGTTWDDAAKTLPTGAGVALYSIKPDLLGRLMYDFENPSVINSDPQTGRFTFNGVFQGNFTVTSSNVFRPTPVSVTGKIETQGQVVNLDLPLKGSINPGGPPVNQPGSVSGQVLMPDGTAAGKDVRVTLTFGDANVTVLTDEAGLFHFATPYIIPAGDHVLTAEDPVTTLKWKGNVYVPSGLEVPVTIKLLGRGSLRVKVFEVIDGNLMPVENATVNVSGSDYPNDSASGATDTVGAVSFANISEGNYAVSAMGAFGLGGRSQVYINGDGANVAVDVYLAYSATVTGRFLKADGITPVPGGQISLKRNGQTIAYTSSSSETAKLGNFEIGHVPLGDFTVEGFDPVTQRRGIGAGRLSTNNETVIADVVVTPWGVVKGQVFNYGGTAPIAGAPVSISVSGVTGFSFSSVTAVDGTFYFSGVPAGRWSVVATDPSNGLSGQSGGTISYEGEIASTQVHIVPTGSIAGRVLMPDGVTPAITSTVYLDGRLPQQVDLVTASFRYDNLAAGRSYSLSTLQPNTRRAGSTVATITHDLEVATSDIILGGVGTVSGVVFDTDGSTLLSGATVELRFSGGTLTNYTDQYGSFSFSDIPTGSFTVVASHTRRDTGASQSGYLQSEGQVATINLVLGPVASVKATVLLADGVTPSRGGGIRITTSNRHTLTGVTDSNGQYTFSSIPTPCTISLYVEDAAGVGIGKAFGILSQNGQVLDFGTIVLDDKPIFVTAVNPASGSVNVPVAQAMRVLFSEPADPATISSSSIYLAKGADHVAGTLQLDTDNSGLTFTPSVALKGFTLYTLVVTDGVTDRVGRKLALQQSVPFTTIDNIPPTLASVTPSDGALQVSSDAVIRLTFSEAIDPASLGGINLASGGLPVAVRSDLIQNGTVVALTPLDLLAYNRTYNISVNGVRDMAGNIMSSDLQTRFNTIDTIPPTVTSVSVSSLADLIRGNRVPITAAVSDGDVASVDFYLDDVLVGTVNRVPYTLSVLLAKEGILHIKAVAQDLAGNRGVPQSIDIAVNNDQPPQVSFGSPADGSSVDTGTQFTIIAQGTDDLNLKEIVLSTTGEMTASQTQAVSGKSGTASFTLNAPAGISSNGMITVSIVARDSGGNVSLPVQRTLVLHDSIAPNISLASLGQSVKYKPGESALVTISASDNVAISSVMCTASGAADANQNFAITPPQPATTQNFSFVVPPSAAPYSLVSVSCTANDMAGNSKLATISLTVADIVPPFVSSSSIVDNATNVPTTATIALNFSETLNPATVSPASFTLVENAAGSNVPVSVTLAADRKTVAVKPTMSLTRGISYKLTITSAVTDDAGNPLAAPYQMRFTADNVAPTIISVTPVTGSVTVPVGSAVSVQFSEQIDPASVTADLIQLTSISGAVPGSLTVSSDSLSLTFKPYNQLGYTRAYTFTLKRGVRDISGNAISGDLTSTFTTQSPDSDLVGYWPMDGDWTDYSGNGNHGTAYNGATFSSDHVVGTQAGSFKGNNDYVAIGNLYGKFPNNTFSIESWVKLDDTGNGGRRTIAGGAGSSADYSIGLNKNQFTVFTYNGSSGFYAESGFVPEIGKWYHVAGTFDGSRLKLYVNGELKSDISAGWRQSNGGVDFWIGQEACCGSNFNGLIDEIYLYRRALLPEDVLEHHNAGLTTDRIPPTVPTVDPVPSSTYSNQIVLRGTKEAGSSVRVNGKQIVAHDANTTWQAVYALALGQNLLDVSSHDLAGNVSPSISLVINLLPMNQKDSSVIGLWHFDGDWNDYSGSGNDLSAINSVASNSDSPLPGMSSSFTGASNYLRRASGNQLPLGASPRTISAWIKPYSYPDATYNGIFVYGPISCNAATLLSIKNDGHLSTAFWCNDSSQTVGPVAPINQWTHVALTYDVGNKVSFYMNGQLVQENTLSSTPNTQNGPIRIGATDDPGRFFNGLIDEVALYNRTLGAQEILGLFNAQPTIVITSLGQTTKYKPGESGAATVTAAHPDGIVKLYCNASGAVSEGTLVIPFDPPLTNITEHLAFRISADATPYAPYSLSCIAETVNGTFGASNLDLLAADLVPPTVTDASIANNATGVKATLPITVTYSEVMSISSLTGDTVILRNITTGALIAGTRTLSADGRTIIFTPAAALDCSTSYQFIIHAVQDVAGNISGDYSINFSTQPATSSLIQNAGTSAAPYVLAAGRYGVVTVKNSYVVLDGPVAADSMSVVNNSTIYQKATGVTGAERLDLVVTGTLSIESGSKIDVTGRGYLGAQKVGNTSNNGRTYLDTIVCGSTNYSGGSYGGFGGRYTSTGTVNNVYGDLLNPNEAGSGGAGDSSWLGGNGGGLIRIQAGTISLAGSIVADGQDGGGYGGGGSGGGIRIDTGTLTGSGLIHANGGVSPYSRGSGGGGRIAIYYGAIDLAQGNVTASGAATGNPGGAGTVYLKSTLLGTDQLIVDNRGTDAGEGSSMLRSMGSGVVSDVTADTLTTTGVAWQPGALKGMRFVPDITRTRYFTVIDNDATSLKINSVEGDLTQATARGLSFSGVYAFTKVSVLGKARLTSFDRIAVADSLLVDGSTLVGTTVSADNLTLSTNGLLCQWSATANQEFKLDLAVTGTLNIESGSKIDVTGRGYLGSYQVGNSTNIGRTNPLVAGGGSTYYSGGSYGGYGGRYTSTGTVNNLYGDPLNPNEAGSGGAGDSSWLGGNGGGLIRIQAGSITLAGNIVADGQDGSGYGGGGSGGGIRIDTGTLTGSGLIHANGGVSPYSRGGGGGGRIAIYYGAKDLPQGNVTAFGATTSYPGYAGTVRFSLLP